MTETNARSTHCFDLLAKGEQLSVYAIFNKDESIDYYDVFDSNGNCLNEGNPFYKKPSLSDLWKLL